MAGKLEVYGFCGANCKHRVLTVDQTADLIQEMAANGFQVPENYEPFTVVNGIREQNKGRELRLWLGTQAEFDAWTGDKTDLYAIISDDQTLVNLLNKVSSFENGLISIENSIDKIVNGTTTVGNATNAVNSTNALVAEYAQSLISSKQQKIFLENGTCNSSQLNYVNKLYKVFWLRNESLTTLGDIIIGNLYSKLETRISYIDGEVIYCLDYNPSEGVISFNSLTITDSMSIVPEPVAATLIFLPISEIDGRLGI